MQNKKREFVEAHICKYTYLITHLIGAYMERRYFNNNISNKMYAWEFNFSYTFGLGDD